MAYLTTSRVERRDDGDDDDDDWLFGDEIPFMPTAKSPPHAARDTPDYAHMDMDVPY